MPAVNFSLAFGPNGSTEPVEHFQVERLAEISGRGVEVRPASAFFPLSTGEGLLRRSIFLDMQLPFSYI